jgi:hypothetical protein
LKSRLSNWFDDAYGRAEALLSERRKLLAKAQGFYVGKETSTPEDFPPLAPCHETSAKNKVKESA